MKPQKRGNNVPVTKEFMQLSTEAGANGCWNWIGGTRNGYGSISINWKKLSAHRVAYELWHGPIPTGLHVCHDCDNKKCINPDHLFAGTKSDNMKDCASKGRLHCQKLERARNDTDMLPGNQNVKMVEPGQEGAEIIIEPL